MSLNIDRFPDADRAYQAASDPATVSILIEELEIPISGNWCLGEVINVMLQVHTDGYGDWDIAAVQWRAFGPGNDTAWITLEPDRRYAKPTLNGVLRAAVIDAIMRDHYWLDYIEREIDQA